MPASGPLPSTPVMRMATVTISVPEASNAARSTFGEVKRPVPISSREANGLPSMTSGSSSQAPPATTLTRSTRSPLDSVSAGHFRRGTTSPLTAMATASGVTPLLASNVGTSTASLAKSHGCWLTMSCIFVPLLCRAGEWMARLMRRGVERGAQAPRGALRFRVGQDGRDDGDTGTAGLEDAVQVVGGDAANGQHGHVDGFDDLAQLFQTVRWQARVRRCGEDVAEGQVVCTRVGCFDGLV